MPVRTQTPLEGLDQIFADYMPPEVPIDGAKLASRDGVTLLAAKACNMVKVDTPDSSWDTASIRWSEDHPPVLIVESAEPDMQPDPLQAIGLAAYVTSRTVETFGAPDPWAHS